MSVRVEGETIYLQGDCHVEQAETLVQLLQDQPSSAVDLSGCRHLHSAVAQVLLAFRPPVQGEPDDAFIRDYLLPNFRP